MNKHSFVPLSLAFTLGLGLAAAADQSSTVWPNQMTAQMQRPPLQVSDTQRAALQDAIFREDTQQKTPPDFHPKAGDAVPLTMTIDVLPPDVVARDPSLEPFAYAKLADKVLVIDPLKRMIVAVMPRPDPSTLKDPTPVEWAQTRGRELTGQAPEQPTSNAEAPQPAGDSGDKKNGTEEGRIDK